MKNHVLDPSATEFRNFNVCPHCEWNGEEAVLFRLSEGIPMISRSDGRNFHLLLADRPMPYSAELSESPTRTVSACFWYVYGADQNTTRSTVAVFDGGHGPRAGIFRQIEFIADLLSDELLRRGSLGLYYKIQGSEIREFAC